MLRNPWPPLAPRLGRFDLLHQAEGLEQPSCEETRINGGQLLFSRGARPLVDCVLASERKGPSRVLDQDFGAGRKDTAGDPPAAAAPARAALPPRASCTCAPA